MKRFWIIAILALLSLAGCNKHKHPKPEPPKHAEQTLFVYMPWATNLLTYFEANLTDLEKGIVAKDVMAKSRIIVFLATSASEADMFEIKVNGGKAVRSKLKSYTDPAFTTAAGIESILRDVRGFSDTERYAMVIGAHGNGWLPVPTPAQAAAYYAKGIRYHWDNGSFTRYFGGLSTAYQTDITTLAAGIAAAGLKMEFMLFDDCYMSCTEVAYDLRGVTDYVIGCPTEVLAYGFPYALMGHHLLGDVDYEGIVDEFYNFYSTYKIDDISYPYGTIGVTDCGQIEALASIMKEINAEYTFDTDFLDDLQTMDGYSPTLFFDFGDYVTKLCGDEALLTRFQQQLELTVPYKRHTAEYFTDFGDRTIPIATYSGITISDPSINELAIPKTSTAWYQASH